MRWIEYESDSDADSDYDGRLDDTSNQRRGEQLFARLGARGEQALDGYSLTHVLAAQFTADIADSFNNGAATSSSEGERRQLTYHLTAQWSAGSVHNRLTGLVEHQLDETTNYAGPANNANQSRDIESAAVALDYGLGIAGFDLSVSARHEQNDRFDDATTWRVGAAWEVEPLNGRLRMGVGEAVKNPGVFELFGYFPAFFVGNPDLQPETSLGWEVGFEQNMPGGRGRWSATWFSSELENEIYTDFGVFPATARNAAGASTREGLELEAEAELTDSVSLFASATFLASEENGVAEIRRPETLASLTLSWAPEASAWSGAVSADYTGDQTDTDFGTFMPVTLDAYTLVSGQLRRRLSDRLELYVRGENLLDEKYQVVRGYGTPGASVYGGFTMQW